jgi:SAM-dependent MidA family methyltransferase
VRQAAPNFAEAAHVHLIETSPRLRAAQVSRLPGATWHHSLAEVPIGPMILVANEFLDALPIRQFVRRADGWTERFVAAGRWLEQPAEQHTVPAGRAATEGGIIEVNEPARAFVAAVGERLSAHPGVALLVDYGPEHSAAGDSLQALARKRPTDPLVTAGSADLTAHVDFADLAATARDHGAQVQGPLPQGVFLTALGLFQRTERLARDRPAEEAAALIQAAHRLVDPAAMGQLFKVMAVCSSRCPRLPGLTAGGNG